MAGASTSRSKAKINELKSGRRLHSPYTGLCPCVPPGPGRGVLRLRCPLPGAESRPLPRTRRFRFPRVPASLRRMAPSEWLGAGLARALFYPTLLYTVLRGMLNGPGHRAWYHRIDGTVLLGALPLRSLTRKLVQDENVRGVITMNEEYETRFLCNSYKEWKNVGVEQLRLSTVDMLGIPTLANLQKGVQFALKYRSLGQCVYVHCKAGRSRSATMVAAYLIQVHNWSPEEAIKVITSIRSHIHITNGQLEVLREFYKANSPNVTHQSLT